MEVEDIKIVRKKKTREKLVMVICLIDVRGKEEEQESKERLRTQIENPPTRIIALRLACVSLGPDVPGLHAGPCCRWRQSAAPCHRAGGRRRRRRRRLLVYLLVMEGDDALPTALPLRFNVGTCSVLVSRVDFLEPMRTKAGGKIAHMARGVAYVV
ncbi:hypothetical protein B296_00041626 [Ensete ventricosum]|uniref:Uncharacterized protein n=1 Tax=Ensete ventricosum TaxID=4639 RepID=A0A426ZJ16_ENSVE|nr:hypothetical protein B296_00041626 [Ensete ventricosum]